MKVKLLFVDHGQISDRLHRRLRERTVEKKTFVSLKPWDATHPIVFFPTCRTVAEVLNTRVWKLFPSRSGYGYNLYPVQEEPEATLVFVEGFCEEVTSPQRESEPCWGIGGTFLDEKCGICGLEMMRDP